MNKVLVTGDRGFVGKHLTSLLRSQGHAVFGFDLKSGDDIRNFEQLRNCIDQTRPDYIYHLAAVAFVPETFINPQRAIDTNITGSLNLLEAVRQLGLKTRILLAGSSEEYGEAESDGEINELTAPYPLSPYAVTKWTMGQLGLVFARAYNMNVVVTRTFNHTAPGRGEMYAEGAFAKQIVEIEEGKRKHLIHGNLDSVRNYTDGRDVVRGYTLAIELDPGIYNICSDNNMTISEMLAVMKESARCEIPCQPSKELFRPIDFSFAPPSCKKFRDLTGWKPEHNVKQTFKEIVESWRK